MNDVARAGMAVADFFAEYGNEASGSRGMIVGKMLKFSKGDWVVGDDDVTDIVEGARVTWDMNNLAIGWQRWEDNKPADTKMGLIANGFKPPRREDLSHTNEDEWETDNEGKPRDPWQFSNLLVGALDPKVADKIEKGFDGLITFPTSSRGGLGAIGEVCKVYAKHARMYPDQMPVCEIGVGSYKHKDPSRGKIKFPVFKHVGWNDGAIFAALMENADKIDAAELAAAEERVAQDAAPKISRKAANGGVDKKSPRF